ncbi:MAG: hypothetical protein VKJ04_11395 [Vampirovibrionales bacterium]|nr:hypothetical protein [Vampirovibrionales bacterium]
MSTYHNKQARLSNGHGFGKEQAVGEWLAGLLIMAVGSFFSPTWWLLSKVMAPYIDFQALLGSSDLIGAYIDLIYKLKAAGPEVLFFQLIPLLTLCVLAGFIYYAACTWVGMRLFRLYVYHLRPQII